MFKAKPTQTQVKELIEILSKNHQQKSTAAKTDVILKSYNITYSPRHLRAVVEHIRKYDLAAPAYLVSSTVNGYWMTSDTKEMRDFLDQELERVSNQYGNIQPLHQRLLAKKQSKNIQQLHLFS